MSTKIFTLYHEQTVLNAIPADPALVPMNLSSLEIGKRQSNLLGEARAFFNEFADIDAEYIGFANARWDQKYYYRLTRLATLSHAVSRYAAPGWVLTPYRAINWLDVTQRHHPSMMPLLDELSDAVGLPLRNEVPSVWCNDFICHRSVFFDWLRFWRSMFEHFEAKYGLELPFDPREADPPRYPAFFWERVTTFYFTHRTDIMIAQLP